MSATGPLAGVTVVDLTRVLAGPYCTMVLADLGARVIKVESPGGGDDARAIGPYVDGKSAYFTSLNRGKESIALDLKEDTGRAIFEGLLGRADVLVENFRPGAMARLGYDWQALRGRYDRLIYAAVSGFGQTGPYAGRPAYDMVVQAMGGLMGLTGHPGGAPVRVGSAVGDITAGLFAAIAINAALVQRAATGRGTFIDVAMLDAQVAILENAIARYTATGEVPGPIGARHPSIAPFAAFATNDGHIVIAAGNNKLFATLCRALGRPDLPDKPLFADNVLRTEHHAALTDELEAALAGATSAHWLATLEAAGVPCGPINSIAQVVADPQVAARNMVLGVDGAGPLKAAGNPMKMTGLAEPARLPPAPDLDADRAAILAELGL